MEKKIFLKGLSLICVLVLVCGYSISTQSKAKITTISFDPGGLNARITIEGSSPLHILNSFYAEKQPLTLVLDLGGIDTTHDPLIIAEKSPLLSGIRIEKEDPDKMNAIMDFFELFYGPEGAQIQANNTIIPTTNYSVEIDNESHPLFAQMADTINDDWGGVLEPFAQLPVATGQAMYDSMWGIINGIYTPEQAAQVVEDALARERE